MNRKQIEHLYDRFKKNASQKLEKRKIDESLVFIEAACKLAYQINFRFTDMQLEENIKKISSIIIDEKEKFNPKGNRIVFYDYFAYDNRGLTQQYLRALFKLDCSILVVIEDDHEIAKSRRIIEEIGECTNAELFVPEHSLSRIEKIKCIADKVRSFCPSIAFLHLSPWDVVACAVWNAFPEVTRYQINLTDHGFWLGVGCADYIIEFRDYGYNLSLQQRGVREDKLLVVPYYPITSEVPYRGIPSNSNGIKILSGGQLYKIYGESHKYFYLLKGLFERHPEVTLYYAGEGVRKPFEDFIRTNNFENRIFLLGNRSDLTNIFKHCDIYLGTYPFCGGLMSQLAGVNSVPIIAYTDKKYRCNYIESLFPKHKEKFQITFYTEESFFTELDKLIADSNYRKERGAELHEACFFQDDFEHLLFSVMKNNKNEITQPRFRIDVDAFCELYLTTENQDLHSIYNCISLELIRVLGLRGLNLFLRKVYNALRYFNFVK